MKVTRLATVLILMFGAVAGAAAQLVVESMEPTMDVLPVNRQRTDLNGQACAVVRVLLPVEGATFEGSVIGDTPFVTNHYWVYMPPGEKMLGINCPGAKPLRVNFHSLGITGGLQSRIIYDLNVTGYSTSSGAKQPVTLNITFTPENATVLIDSEIMETSGGKMSATLEEGDHEYTIAARGYLTAEGVLSLRPGRMSKFRFDLEKAVAKPAPIASTAESIHEPSPTSTQAEQWYAEGMKYYDAKNYAKALPLIRKAAEAGNDMAQFMSGYIYHNGNGVERDYKTAAEWFSKSADQGCADAQYLLGYYYTNTEMGVAQNYEIATDLFRKSAEQGHHGALHMLGSMYETGAGVAQDYKTAIEWYIKAMDKGFIFAAERLLQDKFKPYLTAEQLERAKKMAKK